MTTSDIKTMMGEGHVERWFYAADYRSPGSKAEHYIKLHHMSLGHHYAEGFGKTEDEAITMLSKNVNNVLEMIMWQNIPSLPKVEVKGRHGLKIRGRSHLPRQFMEELRKNEYSPLIIFELVRGENGMVFRMTIREDEWTVRDVHEITHPDMEAVTKFFKMHKQQIP